MPFKFEKLVVWQRSVELSDIVYKVAKGFPDDERYSLSQQIRRASDSVSLNIAEGSTGQSNPEFKRFLNIALRSDDEVVSCIFLARNRNYISQEEFDKIYKLCENNINDQCT
jgi:four helix bundle protein